MEYVISTIPIQPSPNLIGVLAQSGYTLETAIADIIDNSLSAKAKNIDVFFNLLKGEDSYVSIQDDGVGMSLEKMKEAAVIAHISKFEDRNSDDLGRYSLGLKSASASFCDKLYIVSKEEGNPAHTILIDFSRIIEEKKWEASIVSLPNYENMIVSHGTIILWKKIKNIDDINERIIINRNLEKVQNHLSHVYSDYLLNGLVNIKIGDIQIEGWDPFMKELDETKVYLSEEIMYHGSSISFIPYILPPVSTLSDALEIELIGKGLSEQQGFYVFRNGRLISEGGWLGLDGMSISNKYNYARIRVDIPSSLDEDFQVNFVKNSIAIPNELVNTFNKIAKRTAKEAANNYAYRKNPTTKKPRRKDLDCPVWIVKNLKNGCYVSINETHPLIKEMLSGLDSRTRKRLLKMLNQNLPVATIRNEKIVEKSYSEAEVNEMIAEAVSQLERNKVDKAFIPERILNMEPFNKDKYREYVLSYFFNWE